MKTIICLAKLFLLLAPIVPIVYLGSIWHEARNFLKNTADEIVLTNPPTEALNQAEKVIVFSEFRQTWNHKRFLCPSLSAVWDNLLHTHRAGNARISYFVVKGVTKQDSMERSMHSIVRGQFAACQLERRFNERVLLRYWLENAYFGNGEFNITVAADSIFNKTVDKLTVAEAAQIAVLLRIPHIRDKPTEWSKRSLYLLEEFTIYSQNIEL